MSMLSARNKQGRYRLMSEINVTPFVDVMLVLLIVFMITAPLLTAGIAINLPRTKAKNIGGRDTPLIISVTAVGQIFLQETELSRQDLIPQLRAIIANQKQDIPRIFIRGDKDVAYGQVADVIAQINAAGYTQVALITEQKNTDEKNNGTKRAQ